MPDHRDDIPLDIPRGAADLRGRRADLRLIFDGSNPDTYVVLDPGLPETLFDELLAERAPRSISEPSGREPAQARVIPPAGAVGIGGAARRRSRERAYNACWP